MKINISTIIEAIEMADDNFTFFLDLETGKSVLLADEDNPERFFRLPTKFEIHEYNIMEEFIQTLKGEDADKLEQVIQGRGAFRRFKDMVNRRGITKQWYDFQADYYRNLAIAWCQEHGIEYVENCM